MTLGRALQDSIFKPIYFEYSLTCMMVDEFNYGICGVYCGQCPNGNGRVKYAAGELKRMVDTTRYGWVEDVVDSFSFKEFRKGLEWFSSYKCPSCLNIEEAHCKNWGCAKERGLESCLQCDEYLTCEHTEYMRDVYPFVIENYERVKQVGLRKHLEEEEERAKAGVDLMGHLERRFCKTIKV
jgi:transcription elongation factor Elf1